MAESVTRIVLAFLVRAAGVAVLLALLLSNAAIAFAPVPQAEDSVHHHAGTSMGADFSAIADPVEPATGDTPCHDASDTRHCAVSPCCVHADSGPGRDWLAGCVSRLRHPFDGTLGVLSHLAYPQDRPPRRV